MLRLHSSSPIFKARMLIVVMLIVMIAWVVRNQIVGFQPQLIFTVASNTDKQADLYADYGNGLQSTQSLLVYYRTPSTSKSPGRLYFPVDFKKVVGLRFDPVLFTENEEVQIELYDISVKAAAWSKPIAIPLSNLIPIQGVQKKYQAADSAGSNTVVLTVPANTMDPQMRLQLPGGLEKVIETNTRLELFNVLSFVCFGLFVGLIAYFQLAKHTARPEA